MGIECFQRRTLCRQLGAKYQGLLDVPRVRVCLCHYSILIRVVLDGTDRCVIVIGSHLSILAQNALVHVHRLLLEDRWRNRLPVIIAQKIHRLNLWVVVILRLAQGSTSRFRGGLIRVINLEYLPWCLWILNQFLGLAMECFIEIFEMSLRWCRRILRVVGMIVIENKLQRGLVTRLIWRLDYPCIKASRCIFICLGTQI